LVAGTALGPILVTVHPPDRSYTLDGTRPRICLSVPSAVSSVLAVAGDTCHNALFVRRMTMWGRLERDAVRECSSAWSILTLRLGSKSSTEQLSREDGPKGETCCLIELYAKPQYYSIGIVNVKLLHKLQQS